MSALLKQGITKRSAAAVVALALLAGVVAGREDESVSAPAEPSPGPDSRRIEAAQEPKVAVTAMDLDLDKLVRHPRQGTVNDLFGRISIAAPPPMQLSAPPPRPIAAMGSPATPPSSPKPTAPALPFQYLGQMLDGGRAVVFLMRANEPVSLAVGESLENSYRLDQLSEAAATFTYLPLGERQTLSIPQAR